MVDDAECVLEIRKKINCAENEARRLAKSTKWNNDCLIFKFVRQIWYLPRHLLFFWNWFYYFYKVDSYIVAIVKYIKNTKLYRLAYMATSGGLFSRRSGMGSFWS